MSALRFATAGSVDDGKSTLVGRLLHDSKAILADQLEALTKTSAQRSFGGVGSGALDLALLTDGLRAEREQGITIDVAYRYFATDRRSFILADCPGHVQYTKNTVTGASTADAVVVLVDARHGLVEQTRRHLAVARVLRVPHVIAAVNKIDLIDFAQDRYRDIERDVRALADRLGLADVRVIPVSALEGDNVVAPSERTPWYDGEPLLRVLETIDDGNAADDRAADNDDADNDAAAPRTPETDLLRFPVQMVIRPQGALAPGLDPDLFRDYRGYAGQVAAGTVRVGQTVTVLPAGESAVVVGIDAPGAAREEAVAGESAVIRLDRDLDVARGSVIVGAQVPALRQEFDAQLSWLADAPLRRGARVLLKHGTSTVQAMVTGVLGRLDLESFAEEPAEELELNDIGRVSLRTSAALPVEAYEQSRSGGAFLLIDKQSGNTLAAGMAL